MFGETINMVWAEIWNEKDTERTFFRPMSIAYWCENWNACYASAHAGKFNSPIIMDVKICADYKEAIEWAKVRCKELLEQVTKKEEE